MTVEFQFKLKYIFHDGTTPNVRSRNSDSEPTIFGAQYTTHHSGSIRVELVLGPGVGVVGQHLSGVGAFQRSLLHCLVCVTRRRQLVMWTTA